VPRLGRWWFEAAPAERLAALRVLVGTHAFVELATEAPGMLEMNASPPALFQPVGLAVLLDAPLSTGALEALLAATFVSGFAFVTGWRHRVAGPLFGLLLLASLSYRNSWSMIFHSQNLVALHALVLGCTRSADALSLDARRVRLAGRAIAGAAAHWRYGWPLRLVCATTAATYWLAGVAKVMGPLGAGWASGENLRAQVAVDALRKELIGGASSPIVVALYPHLELFGALAVASLVLELGFPAALFHRRLGRLLAVAAFSFHWGVNLLMGIQFPYHLSGVAFAPFFRLERGLARIRALGRALVHRRVPLASRAA
jgi:hypothetical protein